MRSGSIAQSGYLFSKAIVFDLGWLFRVQMDSLYPDLSIQLNLMNACTGLKPGENEVKTLEESSVFMM